MTTREHLEKMLVDNGMFPQQAKEVMNLAIPKIENLVPDYKITWDRQAEEYPNQLYAVWFLTVKQVALKWIDKNLPKAWFRAMFE